MLIGCTKILNLKQNILKNGKNCVQIYFIMKQKRVIEPPIIDKAYLSNLYESIHQRIAFLDKLNEDFKLKQEDHFITSFLNVIEKMGNDLIIAQQAYRNIDIEVKSQQYCMELAKELKFFRGECIQYKKALHKIQEQNNSIKIDKQNMQIQLSSLHRNLEKKIKENLQLKEQNRQLSKKIKILTNSNINKVLKLNSSSGEAAFLNDFQINSKEQEHRSLKKNGIFQMTSEAKSKERSTFHTERIKQCLFEEAGSFTPNRDVVGRYGRNLQSNHSSFRRRALTKNGQKLDDN